MLLTCTTCTRLTHKSKCNRIHFKALNQLGNVLSTDKSLKHLKSKDNFLIVNVSNYFENTQVGTAHHIFNRLFRQLGSAEEPFSEYEKSYEKPVHFCRRNVQNGDNTGMSLMRLLSETMCRSFTPTTISVRP